MKKSILIFLILTFLFQLSAKAHPFYVSVTEIDFKDKRYQISMKVFIDDLEAQLQTSGIEKLNLGEENEHSNADFFIKNYIKNHFFIKTNGSSTPYSFLGKEIESDAVWVYFESEKVDNDIKTIEVKNTLLTDYKEEQTNLIHTNINGEKKSLILSKKLSKDSLHFE